VSTSVFSAVESAAARMLEERYAPHVPVVSTSSAFRYEDDVPIMVPGVNLEHAVLVKRQQRERGWKGFVVRHRTAPPRVWSWRSRRSRATSACSR
jgi:aspartate-semialdehyde dehydrogenase